jgi:hypothetical protein
MIFISKYSSHKKANKYIEVEIGLIQLFRTLKNIQYINILDSFDRLK